MTRHIEIKQQKVNGAFYIFTFFENGNKSVQRITCGDIKIYLKGKDFNAGKLPDGRKIIVLK